MSKVDLSLIDFSLLTKLVKEATSQNEIAVKIHNLGAAHKQDCIVEMSKALGLLSSVKMEVELLLGDYSKIIKMATFPINSPETDFINSLFGEMPKPNKN
jgi:hypothetical protein